MATEAESLPTVVVPYRPFVATRRGSSDEGAAAFGSPFGSWDRFGPVEIADRTAPARPSPFVDDGHLCDQDLARAIVDLLQDGKVALSVPVRASSSPHAGGLGRFADGDQIEFAVIAELRRDGDAVTLVVRIARPAVEVGTALPEPAKPGLPKWRLKRALAFIEANMENPITLHDLAQAAGLSPVYFGAQFRLATGLPPHEYVLRRRIHRAQELLLEPNASLLDVALGVGFQTQAHFSTVFKRIAGDTPSRWRRHRLSGDAD
jgi:AraC-like DNA-binding protein